MERRIERTHIGGCSAVGIYWMTQLDFECCLVLIVDVNYKMKKGLK